MTAKIEHTEQDNLIIEVITVEDMKIHQSYLKEGYPKNKVLHGAFLQNYKGERRCEGAYENGLKQGVWAYYVNNPYHPIARDFFEHGLRVRQEVLHPDGHHLRMVFIFDEKEHPLKQITYAEDGTTITKLDIFQNGLLKEENKITDKGQEQTVLIYNDVFKLIEKRYFLNDVLERIEKTA